MSKFYEQLMYVYRTFKEFVTGKKSVEPLHVDNTRTEPSESDCSPHIPDYDPSLFKTKKDYIKHVSEVTGITSPAELHKLIKDKIQVSREHVRVTLKRQ